MIRRNGNYSIRNKKFKPMELHGERFYDWFDKTFGLQPITLEVKYDTTKPHTSKSDINTNIITARTRYISEDVLGKVEGEPNKSPPNLVQEQPSGSIPQPAVDLAGKVSPVECKQSAGFCPASHARAPFFHNTLPNPCALAHPLSAGRITMKAVNRNTLEPETALRFPADSIEEPDVRFAPHVSPPNSSHHYSPALRSLTRVLGGYRVLTNDSSFRDYPS